ncbi:hypothetical protein C7212DRAFT_355850 [Tuber magnatum]|uniref:Roadblock/LAMTOR2 domain-containing protein n=1 Tax=Tuber magnatum TaxID=42249 RepID=A0A317T5W1_9PEZI|nr:hypothetical protein C7212DRAFT_355850 [Tuber magnatum]
MLKTKPLNDLLSQSISANVSSALLLTPSGSLLATGTSPTAPSAKKSRTHAALAANIWSLYSRVASAGAIEASLPAIPSTNVAVPPSPPETATAGPSEALKSLTLELSDYNLYIQIVAERVLLCLIGPKVASGSSRSSLHSEGESKSTKSVGGGGSGSGSGVMLGGGLGILKTQAVALASYLEEELRGFELPDGI